MGFCPAEFINEAELQVVTWTNLQNRKLFKDTNIAKK